MVVIISKVLTTEHPGGYECVLNPITSFLIGEKGREI